MLFTPQMQHHWTCRVYYEDTDAGGVVYYANYLKFVERARTEMLRDAGLSQAALATQQGIFFVVRHVEMDLHKPAHLDDSLTIHTRAVKVGGASVVMQQKIFRDELLLATLQVKIACVNCAFKPTKLSEIRL